MRQPRLNMKIDPGPRPRESDLQTQIVRVLSGLGYLCLHVGFYRRQVSCPTCEARFYPGGAQGNSPGVADLLISRPGWPPVFAALEVKVRGRVKSENTRVRVVQQMLADQGRNIIVHSIAEAIDALQEVEASLNLDNPRLASFWENNPRRLFESDTP